MAYRGEDLDLRTPQSWIAQGRELQDLFTSGQLVAGPMIGNLRARPIYVDDTVLACLNDAFELATAHRSGEVRLEHLLNAMTRVEAAAKTMELNGIRVTTLRRESGTTIAAELPVAYSNGKSVPRTGADVEEVMRLAAERAYARRQMVAVEDLLDVLADGNRELPSIQLLRRHWSGRPLLRETALTRPFTTEETRERVRVQAPLAPARAAVYTAEPLRADTQQAMTDSLQNTRIEALERLVRQLADELNADRKGMSGVFSDIQRDLSAARDDSARFRGSLAERLKAMEIAVQTPQAASVSPQMLDRLAAVERSLEARFSDLARSWATLGERLQGLEYSVSKARAADPIAVDTAPIERHLGELTRTLDGVVGRLAQIERTAGRAGAGGEPVLERIVQLERAVQNGMGEGARNWVQMGERMRSLEKALAARAPDPSSPQILERLEQIERSLQSRGPGQPVAMTPVLDRIVQMERTLEARNGEAARSVAQLADRLRAVEEQLTVQRNGLGDLANRLSAEIRTMTADQSGMTERVQSLLAALDRNRGELAQAVAQPVNARLAQFDQTYSQTTETLRQLLGQIAAQTEARLTDVRSQVSELATSARQSETNRDRDLLELHEALIKVNGNQETLATSLDQWRLDVAGDMSVLNNRLEMIEKSAEAPAVMMRQLAGEVQSMHALQLKREARKSRFRMWLFGTEDWFGDSWERHSERTAAAVAKSASPAKTDGYKFSKR